MTHHTPPFGGYLGFIFMFEVYLLDPLDHLLTIENDRCQLNKAV